MQECHLSLFQGLFPASCSHAAEGCDEAVQGKEARGCILQDWQWLWGVCGGPMPASRGASSPVAPHGSLSMAHCPSRPLRKDLSVPEPESLCPQWCWEGPPSRGGTTPCVPRVVQENWDTAGKYWGSPVCAPSPSLCGSPFSSPCPFQCLQIPQATSLPDPPVQAPARGLQEYF